MREKKLDYGVLNFLSFCNDQYCNVNWNINMMTSLMCLSWRFKPVFWYGVQRTGWFSETKPNLHVWCCSSVWQISYARMVSSRASSNTNNRSMACHMWNIVPILDGWQDILCIMFFIIPISFRNQINVSPIVKMYVSFLKI